MDNAQKISAECWNWYKKAREDPKDPKAWDKLVSDARKICSQYEGNENDHKFAVDMIMAFIARIERFR